MPVFSHADSARPEFSLSMELLCSVPPSPASVPLSTIVNDLRLTTQVEAHQLIEQLRAAGFTISVTNTAARGRVASIPNHAWFATEDAAEKYWQTMYGGAHANDPTDRM